MTVETAHFCGSKSSNTSTTPTTENAIKDDFVPVDDDQLPF